MAGRPTLLTPEVQAAICKSVRLGNPKEYACQAARISRQTLWSWEKRGEAGEEPYAEFLYAIKAADAECVAMCIRRIRKASIESWQAAAWIIERKDPAAFGQRVKATVQEELGFLLRKMKAELDEVTWEKVLLVATKDAGSGAGRGTGAGH